MSKTVLGVLKQSRKALCVPVHTYARRIKKKKANCHLECQGFFESL